MGAIDRYMTERAAALHSHRAAAAARPESASLTISCRIVGKSGVRAIRIRDHRIVTDAPVAIGGFDLGPSAAELMLGALASCLVDTTVVLAADQRLSLDAVEAEVTARMDLAAGASAQEDEPVAPRGIAYHLDIRSTEAAERIVALRAEIERRSPAFRLLCHPHAVIGNVGSSPPTAEPVGRTSLRIGIIGAGFIGRGLARLAAKAGHDVMISNSRGPESLGSTVASIGCRAGTAEEAASFGELVFIAIPLKAYRAIPSAPLGGKIVVDVNNYYPHRDGRIPELDRHETTTSELLAAHLPSARVVKAFNAILERDLETDGRPPGVPGRRALPIAGDDAEAKYVVIDLLDQFGYDAVDAGPLSEGWRFQRAMPGYCVPLDAAGMSAALAAADRNVEAPHGSWRQRG